jgi:TIR domain-containing protein
MDFKVFISYSTKELNHVERLQNQIKNTNIKVFVAEHSIQPGENLPLKISNAIATCDVFILLWSKNAAGSEWVSQEIGKAHSLGKFVIPIILDKGRSLPAFIKDLKYYLIDDKNENSFNSIREQVLSLYEQKVQKKKNSLTLIGIGALLFWLLSQK